MVGANYMGGKRNTVRAKSKDVVGRAQRRHFGKQRLASALCATQENRTVRPQATKFSSARPEIALAHACCKDAVMKSGAISSRNIFSGDRLYSSRLLSNSPWSDEASEVLDISNHISMRAAIDRILRQPSLIGIDKPDREDTPYTEGNQTSAAAMDVHSDIVSKHVFDPSPSDSPISRHRSTSLTEINLVQNGPPPEYGIISQIGLPPGTCNVASRDGFCATEVLLLKEDDELEQPNTLVEAIHSLPRSSPIPSSSQSSGNSMLNLDTSPCATIHSGRMDDFSGAIDRDSASSLRRLTTHRLLYDPPNCGDATVPNEAAETERSQTACSNGGTASPSTGNNDFRHSSSSDSGQDFIQVSPNRGVLEDGGQINSSIDFVTDLHPWETINKILKLRPLDQCATQPVKINSTKDREGVGYVPCEGSDIWDAYSSDATSQIRTNDEFADDIHMTPYADPPASNWRESMTDNYTAIDTPDPSYTDNSTLSSSDAGPPFTPCAEVELYINAPPAPTQGEHTRTSNLFVVGVGIAAAEPDIDGPCLFGDSDLEEDE